MTSFAFVFSAIQDSIAILCLFLILIRAQTPVVKLCSLFGFIAIIVSGTTMYYLDYFAYPENQFLWSYRSQIDTVNEYFRTPPRLAGWIVVIFAISRVLGSLPKPEHEGRGSVS